ncbi:MAG TPA: hypothetical protein VG754_13870, partial [Verrucomicrobiae bacterium]|nr:hypothetical protein [Verrucomicrobiae bacterium]
MYFKNLTPEEGTADKLLHDLNVLEENTEQLFFASQGKLTDKSKEKFLRGLERVKATCRTLQEKSHSGQMSTGSGSGAFPYVTMGIVFGLGMLMGALLKRDS